MDARSVQHGESVARTVPDRQHDMIGLQIRSVMQVQPAHLPLAGWPAGIWRWIA